MTVRRSKRIRRMQTESMYVSPENLPGIQFREPEAAPETEPSLSGVQYRDLEQDLGVCAVLSEVEILLHPLTFNSGLVSALKKISDDAYTRDEQMSGLLTVNEGNVYVDTTPSTVGKWNDNLLDIRHGNYLWKTLSRSGFVVSEITQLLQKSWADQTQTDALFLGDNWFWRLVLAAPKSNPRTDFWVNECLRKIAADLSATVPTEDGINLILGKLGRIQRLKYDNFDTSSHVYYKVSTMHDEQNEEKKKQTKKHRQLLLTYQPKRLLTYQPKPLLTYEPKPLLTYQPKPSPPTTPWSPYKDILTQPPPVDKSSPPSRLSTSTVQSAAINTGSMQQQPEFSTNDQAISIDYDVSNDGQTVKPPAHTPPDYPPIRTSPKMQFERINGGQTVPPAVDKPGDHLADSSPTVEPFWKPEERPPPTVEPFSKPGERPADFPPTVEPFSKPGARPADFPPTVEPSCKPGERPADFPPTVEPSCKPGERPADFPPIVEPSCKPGERPADFPPIVEPSCKPGERPADFPPTVEFERDTPVDDVPATFNVNVPIDDASLLPELPQNVENSQGNTRVDTSVPTGDAPLHEQRLWNQVWNSVAYGTKKGWDHMGSPLVDHVSKVLEGIFSVNYERLSRGDISVINEDVFSMTYTPEEMAVVSPHMEATYRTASEYVMTKLSEGAELSKPLLEGLWFTARRVTDHAVHAAKATEASVRDRLRRRSLDILTDMPQFLAERSVELANISKDTFVEEEEWGTKLIELSPYIDLYHGINEPGELEYILNGLSQAEYVDWIKHEVSLIYKDERVARNITRLVSAIPVEMAVEKLQNARDLLRQLQSVYSDEFSVNHAMGRLQGLSPVDLEKEITLIRRYAMDTDLALEDVISTIPIGKQADWRPFVDSMKGMTMEEMLHRITPSLVEHMCPNILGVYGPSLWERDAMQSDTRSFRRLTTRDKYSEAFIPSQFVWPPFSDDVAQVSRPDEMQIERQMDGQRVQPPAQFPPTGPPTSDEMQIAGKMDGQRMQPPVQFPPTGPQVSRPDEMQIERQMDGHMVQMHAQSPATDLQVSRLDEMQLKRQMDGHMVQMHAQSPATDLQVSRPDEMQLKRQMDGHMVQMHAQSPATDLQVSRPRRKIPQSPSPSTMFDYFKQLQHDHNRSKNNHEIPHWMNSSWPSANPIDANLGITEGDDDYKQVGTWGSIVSNVVAPTVTFVAGAAYVYLKAAMPNNAPIAAIGAAAAGLGGGGYVNPGEVFADNVGRILDFTGDALPRVLDFNPGA